MSDWHPCMPGHAWDDDGVCSRCGAYEPEKRIKKVEYSPPQEIAGFALRMVVERMAFRIDAMNERGLDGVSISKGFATEIVNACRRGSELLENPEPAQAGLTAGGGSGSANVSEDVTGGGERAVGDAAGETEGHLKLPTVDDLAALDPDLSEARNLAILICPLPSEVKDGDAIERMPGDLLRAATMLGKLCDLVLHYEQLGLRQVWDGKASMTIENCPDCGGTHFGSYECPIMHPPKPPPKPRGFSRAPSDVDWNAESRRLSSGLLAIHAAPASATTAALRSVAYDIALNCIDAETAAFQIKRRTAETPAFDYRCDCCDNGLHAEWDFCPWCGKIQREEPSGLCLAGLAANKACRPDDTLKRCTICGFVVDTQYAAETPTAHLRPGKRS